MSTRALQIIFFISMHIVAMENTRSFESFKQPNFTDNQTFAACAAFVNDSSSNDCDLEPTHITFNRDTYFLDTTITFTQGIGLIGPTKIVMNGPNSQIKILIYDTNGKPIQRKIVLEGIKFVAIGSAGDKSMVEIGGAVSSRVIGCSFNGKGDTISAHQKNGLVIGSSASCFSSTFMNSYFTNCQIGLQVGRKDADQTNNNIIGCTFDHNTVCGAILFNPVGGSFTGNNVERNEAKTGLGIVSGGGKIYGGYYTISGNYFLFNGEQQPSSNNVALRIGSPIPDGLNSIESTNSFRNIIIEGNLIGSIYTDTAIIIYGKMHSIKNNLISASPDGVDIVAYHDRLFLEGNQSDRDSEGGEIRVWDQGGTNKGLGLYNNVYVDAWNGNDNFPGNSPTRPVRTLQTAIYRVAQNGTIALNTDYSMGPTENLGMFKDANINLNGKTFFPNNVIISANISFINQGGTEGYIKVNNNNLLFTICKNASVEINGPIHLMCGTAPTSGFKFFNLQSQSKLILKQLSEVFFTWTPPIDWDFIYAGDGQADVIIDKNVAYTNNMSIHVDDNAQLYIKSYYPQSDFSKIIKYGKLIFHSNLN
jgi:hypothetical protein